MTQERPTDKLPEAITLECVGGDCELLLNREWLIANGLGAYASGSVLGANTRRYHGLLIAAGNPPVGRILALSNVLDQIIAPDETGQMQTYDLATFEFLGKLSPEGLHNLVEFRNDLAATFVFRCGKVEVVKEVLLAEDANAVAVRYRLLRGGRATLRIRPLLAIRDYHGLRLAYEPSQMRSWPTAEGFAVEDRQASPHTVHVGLRQGGVGPAPARHEEQWWHRFRYRTDLARGMDGFEDLFSPGWMECPLSSERPAQFNASLDQPIAPDFEHTLDRKRRRLGLMVAALGEKADMTARRLAVAADAFIVRRTVNGQAHSSIVAGYHWFADWGRDALISLPGLLLSTGRRQEALSTLKMFGQAVDMGMVPNFFDEYGNPPHFNSIDASLWYVIAAWRYLQATGDRAGWDQHLFPVVLEILRHYRDGTRFGIHADVDGLVTGGDQQTQLTWMDAKFAGIAITPRYGKCCEINGLWHQGLKIAQRCGVSEFDELIARIERAYAATFWNEQSGCLFDCVNGEGRDGAVRPNQLIAVAMPDCPLSPEQQRSIVDICRADLLTPYGMRTLSPLDSRYRGRYGTSWESRDKAYHQGTVWPWLMGPFIEAFLKVSGNSPAAREQARRWLSAFDAHLEQAGVGSINEIFDGDRPHNPVGCIAQAWSVAEILRLKLLLA